MGLITPITTRPVPTQVANYTPQPYPTLIPSYPTPTCIVPTPNRTPVPCGAPRVIRTLSDWQNYYGTVTPPVNFDDQMLILPGIFYESCTTSLTLGGICRDLDQITVTMVYENNFCPTVVCNSIVYPLVAAVVPRSDLPVVCQRIDGW